MDKHKAWNHFFTKHPKIVLAGIVITFFIAIEVVSGLVIVSSHYIFGTPKRISLFRFHPLFTGENILQYESNWQEMYPGFGYVNRIHFSDECGFTTDIHGFIHNGDKTRVIKPDKFTIFILGGSTVAGFGSSCNDQTISAYLEKILQNEHRNVEVINAGVAGYFSAMELFKIANEIIFYDPDIIITLGGSNDFMHKYEKYKGRDHAYFIHGYQTSLFQTLSQTRSLTWSIKNLVYNLTKFTEFTYTRFVLEKGILFLQGRIGTKSKGSIVDNVKRTFKAYGLPGKEMQYDDKGFEDVLDQKAAYYLTYIKQTQALVTGMGKRYYYILQPTLYTETGELTDSEQTALEIVKFGYFKKENIDIAKRARYFRKRIDEGLRDTKVNYHNFTNVFSDLSGVYSDYVHYNNKGNSLIAQRIYQILIEDEAMP